MNYLQKISHFMNPTIEADVTRDMDRRSLKNIRIVSIIIMSIEIASMIIYLSTHLRSLGKDDGARMLSVFCCIALCAAAHIVSGSMLQRDTFQHYHYFVFKVVFYILFSIWGLVVDFRHYTAGEQMLTFYTVNLIMVCFILFRPWIGAILLGSTYLALFILTMNFDGAQGIQKVNYVVLTIASIVSNAVLYHNQASVSKKTVELTRSNIMLENASRHDALTGLLNRMALEVDAGKVDGQDLTAYMIDINYFKEINDQYGHAAGDALLKETSEILKQLYPGGRYYRYGGDEFLILTHKPAHENYGADTYDFEHAPSGAKVVLSIGSAHGNPVEYQELFALISRADKALYTVKKRTHSEAYGGHDRRK